MTFSGWMRRAKAQTATTIVACVVMMAATAAKADVYDYTFVSVGTGDSIVGSFMATVTEPGGSISSSSSIDITSGTGTIGAVTDLNIPGHPITSIDGTLDLSSGMGAFLASVRSGNIGTTDSAQGPISGTSSAFSFGFSAALGLFTAVDVGGGSDGVPVPEPSSLLLLGSGMIFVLFSRPQTVARWIVRSGLI